MYLDYEPRGGIKKIFECREREVILSGPAGTGKAQPFDSAVWTPFGPISMGEVRIGETLLHPDGGRREVLEIHPQGDQDVYRLTFSGGASTECTLDHLWEVFWIGGKIPCVQSAVRTTAELLLDYKVGKFHSKYWIRQSLPVSFEPFGPLKDLVDVPPYVLGVLLGDGHLRNGSITFSTGDPALVDAVAAELGVGYVIHSYSRFNYQICRDGNTSYWRRSRAKVGYLSTTASGKIMARLRIPGTDKQRYLGSFTSVAGAQSAIDSLSETAFNDAERRGFGLWNAIAELGLEGKHSWDKFIPLQYKRNSLSVRLAVLQGLLDTDGTVDRGSNCMPSYTTVSLQLVLDVKEIVESLGGICSISANRKTGGRVVYTARLRLNDNKSLFRLPRKRDLVKDRKWPVKRILKEIVHLGRKPCQCITISDPNGLYLTDDFIVTHNSRGSLEKLHWINEEYPGVRTAMVRKSRKSLTQSGMITYTQKVLPSVNYVPFHGERQQYEYPNGSILAVGGLDDPSKLFSSEWDVIFIQQAEELDLEDWASLKRGLRSWKMPYQQLYGDCNPGPPDHWIKQRQASGDLVVLDTIHEDNPELYNGYCPVHNCIEPGWTCRGTEYMKNLDSLPGALYLRLRKGLWASAEGAIYEKSWERATHVIDRFVTTPLTEDQVPKEWTRYWVIDFGYRNPFVWQAWAEDPDGRLFRYKEIYRTQVTVRDHCKRILEITAKEPKPSAVICDHDAEDRATFEQETGLKTRGAYKAVIPGIQAVETRLRKDSLEMPQIFFLRDSLIDLDSELLNVHKPTCTEAEIENYVWDTSAGRRKGEEPLKKNDHGCFIAGTSINTQRGVISIEKVLISDFVLTREGYRRVLVAGCTDLRASVSTVLLSNGQKLTGTRDHPIWVVGKGFIRLDALRYYDTLLDECGFLPSQTEKPNQDTGLSAFGLMGSSIDVIQKGGPKQIVNTFAVELGTQRLDSVLCTETSGGSTEDESKKGLMSTTQMVISIIIGFLTSNSFHGQNTNNVMRRKLGNVVDFVGNLFLKKNVRLFSRRPQFGIVVRQELRGIVNTVSGLGGLKNFVILKRLVRFVESLFGLVNHLRSFVGIIADRNFGLGLMWMPSTAFANFAVGNSCVINTFEGGRESSVPVDARAEHVENLRLEYARPAKPGLRSFHPAQSVSVPCCVLTVTEEKIKVPVYNLTVDGSPEYFANGVLVHNCDAMRYLVCFVDDVAIVKPQVFDIISVTKEGVDPTRDLPLEQPSPFRVGSGYTSWDEY